MPGTEHVDLAAHRELSKPICGKRASNFGLSAGEDMEMLGKLDP